MIKIGKGVSSILPLVFKRGKESEDCLFFSVPNDFKMNLRVDYWNEEKKQWEYKDVLYPVVECEGQYLDVKVLCKDINENETKASVLDRVIVTKYPDDFGTMTTQDIR